MNFAEELRNIKLLISDVDGVMTDGTIWLDTNRCLFSKKTVWRRRFNVKDGVGLRRLMKAGFSTAVISAGSSKDVRVRMEFLGIQNIYLGAAPKVGPFEKLLNKTGLKPSEVAYIGDDVYDVPIIEAVQFGVSVPNAFAPAKEKAQYVTEARGGEGAVREVCELLLKFGYFRKGKG